MKLPHQIPAALACDYRRRMVDVIEGRNIGIDYWRELIESDQGLSRSQVVHVSLKRPVCLKITSGHLVTAITENPGEGWGYNSDCNCRAVCHHVIAAFMHGIGLFWSISDAHPSSTNFEGECLSAVQQLGWKPVAESPGEQRLIEKLKRYLNRPLSKEQVARVRSLVLAQEDFTGKPESIIGHLDEFFASRSVAEYIAYTLTAKCITKIETPEKLLSLIAAEIRGSRLYDDRIPSFLNSLIDMKWGQDELAAGQRKREVLTWRERMTALARPFAIAVRDHPEPDRLRLRLDKKGRCIWESARGGGEFTPLNAAGMKFLIGYSVTQYGQDVAQDSDEVLLRHDNASIAFLSFLRSHHETFGSRVVLQLANSADRKLIANILRRPTIADCLVGHEGTSFAKSGALLRHRTKEGDDNHIIFDMVFDDGSEIPEGIVVLNDQPPTYLDISGGRWFDGQPPINFPCETLIPTAVPREVFEDNEAGKFIALHSVPIPTSLKLKVRRENVDIQILACLGSTEGEWQTCEAVCVQIFVIGENGQILRDWDGSKWRLPQTGEVSDVVFDTSILTRAETCLQTFPFFKQSESVGRPTTHYALTSDDGFADRFSNWLRSFPKDTKILLSGELAGLTEQPTDARYEFSLQSDSDNSGIDWFGIDLKLSAADVTLSKREIELLRNANGRFVRLKRGWKRLRIQPMDTQADGKLAKLGVDSSTLVKSGPKGIRFHALQLDDDVLRDVFSAEDWARIRTSADSLVPHKSLPAPEGLRGTLRPYQQQGFEFLAFLSANRLCGILADDMGLGKTIQALTWLLWLKSQKGKDSEFCVLIVCPKSVQPNWAIETERFAPEFSTSELLPRKNGDSIPRTANLVIINYAQLRFHRDSLQAVPWDAVILDEAQNIKNPESIAAQVACELKTTHRLILSGTPIENRCMDLWSLFRFAMPGLLGSRQHFKKTYESADADKSRSSLRARVKHFMLRRVKKEVAADLPERNEEEIYCDLTGTQRELYDAELKRARSMLSNVKTDKDFDRDRFNILTSLLRLRQICCHPRLVSSDDHTWADDETCSAKLEALLDQIEPIVAEGHKVLIFSQFLTMIDMISKALKKRLIDHVQLTGETNDRLSLINRFQTEPGLQAFLISLRAGGSGINLTAASYVILFDPWWNPAVENQAIDRTHRIGQKNVVNAYRLIARNTVEEKMRDLKKEKRSLASAIVQEEDVNSVMDLDSIRRILA